MDLGFPTQAGGRRAPEVVRYTGRETRGHSFSDEAAGPFRSSPQAPHPSPRGGTVPVTHPSRERAGRKCKRGSGRGDKWLDAWQIPQRQRKQRTKLSLKLEVT